MPLPFPRLVALLLAAVPYHCLGIQTARAQDAVAVGQGSYAGSAPVGLMVDPRRKVDLVEEVEQRPLYLVKEDARQPIPSNKWFQNLLFKQYGTGLWPIPQRVDATAEGIEIFQPISFSGDGVRAIAEYPLVITGKGFKPIDSRAKAWSDWLVSFRCFESDARHLDVTLGEGMPAVWCEFRGLEPMIALGGTQGKGSRGRNAATFFSLTGGPTTLPSTGDTLGLRYEGRVYGVFASDGTRFEQTDKGIAVKFAGTSTFLVVCPLPDEKAIGYFHQHAFAVPRETRLSWNYDRQAGTISTTWKVVSEPLKPGAPLGVIQGFLPHHWRENTAKLDLAGPAYQTIRGALKTTAGSSFTLTHSYQGILPNLPAPTAKAYDPTRTHAMLAEYFAEPKKPLVGDTYYAGKELQRYAEAAFIATQTKDPTAPAITHQVRSALEGWFTYQPGKKAQFFAYYPHRKALVGFPAAYGSEHLTDTHFHQGYFVYTAGLLSQLSPEFGVQYGEMARLVARNYANYDPRETRFPRFRTFDLWRGHSFADGNGFPDGNNQESTGEAVNSWAGMILLGEALGDPELTAAGVMGYSFETRANLEYWFDPHGDVFPKAYAHHAAGMIWSGSIVWGTWFTGSPAWIYGIQWLPSGPHAAFYDRQPDFITKTYGDLQRELAASEEKEAAKKPGYVKKPVETKILGGELASYHLGFRMHAEAARVVAELDQLWAEPGDKVAHSEWMTNLYYQASALCELGRVDWTAHGNTATSMVYANPAKKTRTLLAWNPTGKPQTVEFFEGARSIGRLLVAPGSLGSGPAK